MYKEDEFLQLSGIQHFEFCRRQWALIHVENQWQENVRTVEGELLHKRVHNTLLTEKRGDLLISRAMPIHSKELGISGECDVVEFHKSKDGISLFGREGLWRVIPVEYKRGKPKKDDMDVLQLAAQAICLEEMLCCEIPKGYLYYGETRHRVDIEFSVELREKVKKIFLEMHQYYDKKYTPKVKKHKGCNACSLKNICLPILMKQKSVSAYMENVLGSTGETL